MNISGIVRGGGGRCPGNAPAAAEKSPTSARRKRAPRSVLWTAAAACALVLLSGAYHGAGAAPAEDRAARKAFESFRISQVDNSSLLVNQTVKVYVSATDAAGVPVRGLEKEHFSVFERSGRTTRERAILSFEQGANINHGVNLLLVLDNSGSMYWDGSGRVKNSRDPRVWRITHAKNAVLSLLNETKNPRDRVGLVVFNVKIRERITPTGDKGAIGEALEGIAKPSEEEAYTELYETLHQSIGFIRSARGRRAIVVLSDGQDFPMKNNPHFPTRAGMEKAIEEAQREGISVFTIGLGAKADRTNLSRIAGETGGAYFSADDPEQLKGLYALIREQILNEYLIAYKATMDPAEKKLVTVRYRNGGSAEADRHYFSATLFGMPAGRLDYTLFLPVPAALALLYALSRIRRFNKGKVPTLSVIPATKTRAATAAHARTGVRTFAIDPRKTVITIGGGERDDIAISGDPKVGKTSIERKGGVFTLRAEAGSVTVNNRPVKTKALRSGDVIKIGGTTVVFDEGVKKES